MPERKTAKFTRSTVSVTQDEECTADGFHHTKDHKSLIQMSAKFNEDPVREENEKIICTVDTLPSDAYNILKQSGLNTPEGTPCRSRNMCTEANHGDDTSTAKSDKNMTSTAMKKVSHSHLRKSIQSSIGRLIHGTERSIQHKGLQLKSQQTSQVTADIRLRRRQSLTGIPPPPSTVSCRSSLGGKSDIK
ncbi:hypothetical protein U9M48_021880, partial [Paspalum notatum var. saurae]